MKQETKSKRSKSSVKTSGASLDSKKYTLQLPGLQSIKLQKPEHSIKYYEHIIFAGILAAGLILSALTIFIFGMQRSLAPLSASSIPLRSDMTEEQVKQTIEDVSSRHKLALELPDGTTNYFKPADSGVSVDAAASAKKVKAAAKQEAFSRMLWWQPIKVGLVVKVDQAALQAFISTHVTKANTVAKDATIAIDKGNVVVTEEVPGSGVGLKNAAGTVAEAVGELQKKPLKLEAIKLPPAITVGNLKASQKKVENILSQQVSFTINGQTVNAKRTDIAGWIELSPVEAAKTVDVTVNSGKVLQYINAIAKPYIQPPRSKLIMNTPDGAVVLDSGANGVDVVSKDKVAAAVVQKLLKGEVVKTDLPVKFAAASAVEVQPYDKWIVVDVTTKRMYAYEQTKLVKSFLVSAGAPKTPTVIGQFSIYSKRSIQDMRGSNADGSRYFQPDVQYVNYFYKDYAIHGNYWRPLSYFGNVNSSHGCVGIVNSDAAWLYDWAPIGTPVIVHK